MNQALADLAHVIRYKKTTVPGLANSKVILIGCSYAGNLVSYFRQLYPDLVDGVWSAGAALLYRLDYSGKFILHISKTCIDIIYLFSWDGFVSIGKSIRKIGGDKCYDRLAYASKEYLHHKKENTSVYTQLRALNLSRPYDEVHEIMAVHVQHRKWVLSFIRLYIKFSNCFF